MINNMSITSMHHRVLTRLEEGPFTDLFAEDSNGNSFCFSLDQFRRLYNDAVESMHAYRNIAEELDHDNECYKRLCSELEKQLREIADC